MFPRITQVRYIEGYRLELTFADGKKARLDFRDRVVGCGGVFAPLDDGGASSLRGLPRLGPFGDCHGFASQQARDKPRNKLGQGAQIPVEVPPGVLARTSLVP